MFEFCFNYIYLWFHFRIFYSMRFTQQRIVLLVQKYWHTIAQNSNIKLFSTNFFRPKNEQRRIRFGLACGTSFASFVVGRQLLLSTFPSAPVGKSSKDAPIVEDELLDHQRPKPNLPMFTMQDVQNHNSIERGVWVALGHGVYDVSSFVTQHPGGDRILLAAGRSLEPFWMAFPQHLHSSVYEILDQYRIGNLDVTSVPHTNGMEDVLKSNPFALEPVRDHQLVVRNQTPFNAESPPELLFEDFLTPNDIFFVRNHLPVPVQVNEADYRLSVAIDVRSTRSVVNEFSLSFLQSHFTPSTVTTTIQCSGNRRQELNKVKPVQGLGWDTGAIGTAKWTGVMLMDVLNFCNLPSGTLKLCGVKHMHFEGRDADSVTGETYGASVPIDMVTEQGRPVVLAWLMNHEPLSRDHGQPLRAIVPGVVGARQVKWLRRVTCSAVEFGGLWQQRDYKQFNPSIDRNSADFGQVVAIQDNPVVSAICHPLSAEAAKQSLQKDSWLSMKGYAWSGGGQRIVRVDISADGGKTWNNADLLDAASTVADGMSRAYCWTRWQGRVPLPSSAVGPRELQLVVKAIDASHNTQPDRPDSVWNFRGLGNNAWHRVHLTI